MNNFNPYAYPYSYQENPYGYYGNLPKQQHNYPSSPFNHVRMDKEENQSKSKNKQRNKTSKPSIYANEHIDKTTGTKPVIFSAPEVSSKQLNKINYDNDNGTDTEKNDHSFKGIKKDDHKKQEKISSLINDFLGELHENSIIEDSSSTHEESIDETRLIATETSDKHDAINEDSTYTKKENVNSLLNDFSSMLDENLDSSQSDQGSAESRKGQNVSLEDTFHTMLSDNQHEPLPINNKDEKTNNQKYTRKRISHKRFSSKKKKENVFKNKNDITQENFFNLENSLLSDESQIDEKGLNLLNDSSIEKGSSTENEGQTLDEMDNRTDQSKQNNQSDQQEKSDLDPSEDKLTSNQDSDFLLEEKLYSNLKDKKSLEDKFSLMLKDAYSVLPQEPGINEDNTDIESSTKADENGLESTTPEDNKFSSKKIKETVLKSENGLNQEKMSFNLENTLLSDEPQIDENSPLVDEKGSSIEKEGQTIDERDNRTDQSEQNNHSENQEKTDLEPSEDISISNQDSSSLEEELYSKLKDKKSLEDKFSLMLKDAYSEVPQEQNINEDNKDIESSKVDEISINLLKDRSIEKGSPIENEDQTIDEMDNRADQSEQNNHWDHQEKSDLDPSEDKSTSNEDSSSLKEKLYSKLKDKKSLEDKFSLMLKDAYSERSQEPKINEDNKDIESSIKVDENGLESITTEDNKDTESNTEQDCTLMDKSANMLEDVVKEKVQKKRKKRYKSKKHIHVENPFIKEPLEDEPHQKVQKSKRNNNVLEKKHPTIVKMPVLLGQLDLDVNIVQTLHLMMPIHDISKVEWSIKSLDCQVVLPSTTVFIKGVLIADIEFINQGMKNTIHSLKVPIPWSKTTNIHWLSLPDLSQNSHNEFMFHSRHDHDGSFHYESFQKFAEPIKSQLNQIDFVWHQELEKMDKKQKFDLQGTAHLNIDISQEQFIKLDIKKGAPPT